MRFREQWLLLATTIDPLTMPGLEASTPNAVENRTITFDSLKTSTTLRPSPSHSWIQPTTDGNVKTPFSIEIG